MSVDSQARICFLEQYRHVRYAEGRGSEDPAYYRALPYEDLTGRNKEMWAMRARTYKYFERRILPIFERTARRSLDILDLGAGNCWMSYRLLLRKHCPVSLDIFRDPMDGLLAARAYPFSIPLVEAEFNCLPFRRGSFDLVIFNASIHYSTDYFQTLTEALRCLRPNGHVVILDTPIYRCRKHGERMVEERKAAFQERYGFPSDAMNSVEFLDWQTILTLARSLKLKWRVYRPWYGWRWHLRPLKAFVQRRRAPSRFFILVGSVGAS